MRRTLAVVLSAGLLLVWSFCQDLSIDAQVGPAAATENGDGNGDGKRDIADAVSLLTWLFEGGSPPVACAQTQGCDLTAEECERLKEDLAFARRVAGTYFANFNLGDGFKGFLTLTADGGLLLSTQAQYGAVTGSYHSLWHGTWKATGDHEIRADTWLFPAIPSGWLRRRSEVRARRYCQQRSPRRLESTARCRDCSVPETSEGHRAPPCAHSAGCRIARPADSAGDPPIGSDSSQPAHSFETSTRHRP